MGIHPTKILNTFHPDYPIEDQQLCLVCYLFIFTHHFIGHKRFHVGPGSDRVRTFLGNNRRLRESEWVNNHYCEHTSRFDKTGDTDFSQRSFSPLWLTFPFFFVHSFSGAWGLEGEYKLSLYIPGPRPGLEWWEIQFTGRKKRLLELPLHHLTLSPLHPHLQGRSWGAKPKPDGLIGPKDNK